MKTAVQQLIESIEDYVHESHSTEIDIEILIMRLRTEFIPIEKHQIENAFNTGFKDTGLSYLLGEQYYKQTFKED